MSSSGKPEQAELILGLSEGGLSASHPTVESFQAHVAPAVSSEFNLVRAPLLPIACSSLLDGRFDFDSSFVRPELSQEMRDLADALQRFPGARLAVFGHADPVGGEEYNKALSGQRAEAIFAMLTRNTSMWERLYVASGGVRPWGLRETQVMLDALLFDPQRVDGVMDEGTRQAVIRFQDANGLKADGKPGPQTRAKLFLAYMDFLCRDSKGEVFSLKREQFVAGGADPQGKGDFQGCSEFNPLLRFSQEEEAEFKKPANKQARDSANAPNRRVVIFFFSPQTKVDPAKWPCPRTREGSAGCRTRFFADAGKRSAPGPERRKHEDTHDTFQCRFYDRFAHFSPCERVLPVIRIRLFDSEGNVLVGAPFLATTSVKQTRGRSDSDGDAVIFDVAVPTTCVIEWGLPGSAPSGDPQPDEKLEFSLSVFLEITEADRQAAAAQRLSNLGYMPGADLTPSIKAFQRDAGKPETGKLEDIEEQLKVQHDELVEPPITSRREEAGKQN